MRSRWFVSVFCLFVCVAIEKERGVVESATECFYTTEAKAGFTVIKGRSYCFPLCVVVAAPVHCSPAIDKRR